MAKGSKNKVNPASTVQWSMLRDSIDKLMSKRELLLMVTNLKMAAPGVPLSDLVTWYQRQLEELEQERTRLAGVLTVAEGHFDLTVKEGTYGWSIAYARVAMLRMEYDSMRKREGKILAPRIAASSETPPAVSVDPEYWAQQFHEVYERLAPSFGYETREETKSFSRETKNGKLMIAVIGEVGVEIEKQSFRSGFQAGLQEGRSETPDSSGDV